MQIIVADMIDYYSTCLTLDFRIYGWIETDPAN